MMILLFVFLVLVAGCSPIPPTAPIYPTGTTTPTPTASPSPQPPVVLVTRLGETWHIRSAPGADSRALAVLASGTSCTLLEARAWILVSCGPHTGWVHPRAFGR